MERQKIRLTREFSFEAAHALDGYDGLCRNVHGHSYKLFVTVRGVPCGNETNPKLGMVVDFSDIKRIVKQHIVDRLDHSLVLADNRDNRQFREQNINKWQRIEIVPYQPTCENMLTEFAHILRQELPKCVELVALKLYETEKSYAEWLAQDNC